MLESAQKYARQLSLTVSDFDSSNPTVNFESSLASGANQPQSSTFSFVQSPAESLGFLGDASVDLVISGKDGPLLV